MPAPTLSICIPTYNRAPRLSETVHALISQIEANGAQSEVEICISDNASTDETPAVLESLLGLDGIRLITACLPEHRNFAHNCQNVVELATGEFIALCGDDDPMCPDGLAVLFEACRTCADVVLLNSHPTHITRGLPSTFAVADPMTCVTKLGVFHASFIGNLVIRRAQFVRHFTTELLDSAYPHYAVVMRVLRHSGGIFLNRATVRVDDRLRGWRAYQAVYTAVDMARLQTEEVLPAARGRVVRELYLQLCRSIPRALLVQRAGLTKSIPGNRYADLGLRNVLDCYRRARDMQLLAGSLWVAGRIAPRPALRGLLLVRDKAKAIIGRLGRVGPIQTRLMS